MEAIHGETHANTLLAKHKLANILYECGKHSEAEAMHSQVLVARKLRLGETDPEILSSMNDLALTLILAGKYQQAEELLQQTLLLRTPTPGEEHPDTLETLNDMAVVRPSKSEKTVSRPKL